MFKPIITATAFVAPLVFASSAQAQAGTTFVEIGAGGAAAHTSDVQFINPDGGAYIKSFAGTPVSAFTSPVVGDDIIIGHQRRDGASPTADASVGYFISDSLFVRATYRYLGRYHFSGSAVFPVDPQTPIGFEQDYYLRAHGLYAGVGYQLPLGTGAFVELSAEGGAARLRSVSTQGANIGDPLGHPAATRTRLSGGAQVALGTHLNSRLDLLVSARADWLGDAETGVSEAALSADGNWGINPNEQLKVHDVVTYGGGVGLRFRF